MLTDLLTACPARDKSLPFSFGVTTPEVKVPFPNEREKSQAVDEGNVIHSTSCAYEKWRNEESGRINVPVK